MSLTRVPGPLAGDIPAEVKLNYAVDGPKHRLLMHPFPRRIRGYLGGEIVVDTTRGVLLHETAISPRLYIPEEDFNEDLLTTTDYSTHCPFKGDANYWTINAGGETAENAVWGYPGELDGAEWLKGYRSVYFEAMDTWKEEDEEIFSAFRDPFHRVDVRRSDRPAKVTAKGEVLAESANPTLVFETGVPTRVYFAPSDVEAELAPSETSSLCPYKGLAGYNNVTVGESTLEDAVWFYEKPLAESEDLGGLLSFWGDEVTVELDGKVIPS